MACVYTQAPGRKTPRAPLYKPPSTPHSSALPGRHYSVLGVSGVLVALVLFQLSPTTAMKLAVAAPLFVTWACIKLGMAITRCRQASGDRDNQDLDEWSDSLSEDGSEEEHLWKGGPSGKTEGPSCLQRLFRQYYLYDQAASAVPRAVSWFCFVALVLMVVSYDGSARLAHKWSLFSCFSESCCRAAEEENWDMSKVQCHKDANSTCVMPQVWLLKEMCLAAAGTGWWRYGISSWWALALWCLRELKQVIFFWSVPLPRKPTAWANDPKFLVRIGAVIPCHQSEAEIASTCRSIMHHLPPQNIVVVDNANSPEAPDNTRAVVRAVHPDIAYVYVPVGLKTLALYTGMLQLPGHVEFMLHMDDDTVLPEDMVFDETWFEDPTVAEVTYPIFTREVNLLTSCVDFLFKMDAHARCFANVTTSTSLWAAGIIGLVRRSVFMKVMPDHVFLPFGEDAYNGMLMLANNYKIKCDARSNAVTFAPPVFSTACAKSSREQGYGAASLFKQRAQRWMVTKLRRMGWTCLLLFTFRAGSLWSNVWFRIRVAPEVLLCLVSITALPAHLPLTYYVVLSGQWQVLLAMMAKLIVRSYIATATGMSIINFVLWKHRPDFQVHWTRVLFTPIVQMFLVICQVIGNNLAVVYWLPFVPTRVHVFTHHGSQGRAPSSSESEE